ncbi:MAG: hypothetical protein IJU33_04430 [Bacteroidales bacterium]|jgi:hypothetical protein|nr:hypothetical protein [Bacteroidales bacterium]MBR0122264.1 hypothetical protein [Bacteroidales bacterium]
MNEIDITLGTLAEKVKALIQKNKDLKDFNAELQVDYENKIKLLEEEKENINNQLSEEMEKRQQDKETLQELIREVDECLEIFNEEKPNEENI